MGGEHIREEKTNVKYPTDEEINNKLKSSWTHLKAHTDNLIINNVPIVLQHNSAVLYAFSDQPTRNHYSLTQPLWCIT